jgi:hypothetical protein
MSNKAKWDHVAKDAGKHEHHVHAVREAIAKASPQTPEARGLAAWTQIKANGDAMLAAGEPLTALIEGGRHIDKHQDVLLDSIANGVTE